MPSQDIAIAIVRRDSLLLITQRLPHVKLPSYYEFPGGKLLQGEPPAQAALRELEEETAIVAQILRPLQVIEHTYPHATLRLHPFLCQYISGTPTPKACQRALWIPPTDLPKYRFPPANTSLLTHLMATLNNNP